MNSEALGEAGGPDLEKFLFVGMRIEEILSLLYLSRKYRVAEGCFEL